MIVDKVEEVKESEKHLTVFENLLKRQDKETLLSKPDEKCSMIDHLSESSAKREQQQRKAGFQQDHHSDIESSLLRNSPKNSSQSKIAVKKSKQDLVDKKDGELQRRCPPLALNRGGSKIVPIRMANR